MPQGAVLAAGGEMAANVTSPTAEMFTLVPWWSNCYGGNQSPSDRVRGTLRETESTPSQKPMVGEVTALRETYFCYEAKLT